MVKIKGKTADVQDIKVEDTVTVRFLKSDNLTRKRLQRNKTFHQRSYMGVIPTKVRKLS